MTSVTDAAYAFRELGKLLVEITPLRVTHVQPVFNLALSTANVPLWVPEPGYAIRLMGAALGTGTGPSLWVKFTNGVNGAVLFVMPMVTQGNPLVFNMGDGVLVTHSSGVLGVEASAIGQLNGTLWGRIEPQPATPQAIVDEGV